MKKTAKRVRQMLTMLLAVSMLAGSIPMNAWAMENVNPTVIEEENVKEEELSASVLQETGSVSENETEQESEDALQLTSEETTESEEISGSTEAAEGEETADSTEAAEGEETTDSIEDAEGEETTDTTKGFETEEMPQTVPTETVSGNLVEKMTEATAAEEEEIIDITFNVINSEYASFVKIIRMDDKVGEVELEGNTTTAVKGKLFKFKLETQEGYKVKMVLQGSGSVPFDTENGYYYFTPQADTAFDIEIAVLQKYNVSFSYDAELVNGLDVKMGLADVTLEDNVAVGMWEDSVISFEVDLHKKAKIVKVTANGEEISVTEDANTYALEPLEEDVEVKIETSLDETKCNTLDIYIWGHKNSISVKKGAEIYEHGEKLLTKNNAERITVHLDNTHYKLDQLLLNGEDAAFDEKTGYAAYDLDFTNAKNQMLVIYTSPKPATEEKKIIFANKAPHITYEVNLCAKDDEERVIGEQHPIKKNTYTVYENETLLEFSITHKDGYKPRVTIPSGIKYDMTTNGNTITYSVVATTLGNEEAPTEITIEEVPQTRTISVIYDAARVEKLDAIVEGKYITPETETSSSVGEKIPTTREYKYVHGTEIVLQVESKDEFILDGITEKDADDKLLKETYPKKKEYAYTVKVDQDKKVELELEGAFTTDVYTKSGETPLESKKENVYQVEAGETYKLILNKGNDPQILKDPVLKQGSTQYEDKVSIKDSLNLFFEIPENTAGKTLTLEMKVKGENEGHTVTLEVLPEAAITKITGVKNGVLSQTADTVKEYVFTSNLPKELNRLGVEIVTAKNADEYKDEAEENRLTREKFEAVIEEDKLIVTVKTSAAGEKAYLKIYDVLKSTETKKHYVSGGTILVTSKAPAFVSAKPTVTLKSATNLDLILSLGMNNLEEIEQGKYWYKIEVIPQYTTKTVQEVKDATAATGLAPVYVECTDLSQQAIVKVVGIGDETIEEGKFKYATDHKVRVSLLQTNNAQEPLEKDAAEEQGVDSNVAFISKTPTEIKASTRAPYYETKLGIKTMQSKVYSGQEEIVVASPVFSKTTSYQKIEVESQQEGIVPSVDENNNILVSVDKNVEPGKYVMKVVATAAENTVPATKEFTIQVEQGIYALELKVPKEVYKQYKKEASVKAEIIYNEDDDKKQPKNKKVEWSLLDAAGNVIDEEHPSYETLTMKNGVVTVSKDFVVSQDEAENTFYVKATAMDYEHKEGSEIEAVSGPIVITNRKISLGELVLVKENAQNAETYDVIARSGYTVSIDKVEGSKLVMLKKGTPERDQCTAQDFLTGVDEQLLAYTSSSKALEITDDKNIKTKGVVKGITLSVKTTDGSNVKSDLSNLTVTYTPAGNLGVEVSNPRTGMAIVDKAIGGTTSFYGAKDETLNVKVWEVNEKGHNREIYGGNYKLNVQGAKVIESNPLEGEYVIVGTADTIVLQLVNNTLNYTKTYTLKNASLANQAVRDSKKLSLKAEGNLETGYFTEEQKLVYTLPKESIGKYTHAWVTVDKLDALDEKKAEYYEQLVQAAGGSIGEVQQLGSDGKVVISFKGSNGEEYYIPQKNFTYKLNIAFGTMNTNYEFEAQAKTNAITIKTKDVSLANAKLTTSYSISAKESGVAQLTLNNKKVTLSGVGSLMNVNLKGKENNFTEFFEIDPSDYTLKLKDGVDLSVITKDDLTGYVSWYTYTDGSKEKTIHNTLIKVAIKDLVQKYSLSKSTVLAKDIAYDKIDTDINVLAGKDIVKALYVHVPQKENFKAFVNADGSVNIQSENGVKNKASNKVTVYVIPEYSYQAAEHESELEALKEAAYSEQASSEDILAYENAMIKYGIKLSTTISVKNMEKTSGKIKFAGNDLKPKLTEEDYEAEVDSATLDGSYEVKVPYTMTVDWDAEEIYNKEADSSVKIKKVEGKQLVRISLDKDELREGSVLYGKTVAVKAVVKFGDGTKDEEVTFKVTLPKKPVQLQAVADGVDKIVWSDVKTVYDVQWNAETALTENISMVEEKVKKLFSKDGDLTVTVTGEDTKTKLPTKEKAGELVYQVEIRDVSEEKARWKTVKLTLDKLLVKPAELEEKLQEAVAYWESPDRGVTNLTALSTIVESVRSRVGVDEDKNTHLRLYAAGVVHEEATETANGEISGIFRIVNVADRNVEAVEVEFHIVIPKLLTLKEAAEKVKNEVEEIVIYNADLENPTSKESQILEIASNVLIGQDYFVEIKQGCGLDGERAQGSTQGSATITLELIDLTAGRVTEEVVCEFVVLEKAEP